MSQIIKSGAFIQQCFSSHPLCLDVRKLHSPPRVILKCTSCNLLHGLTLNQLHCVEALSVAQSPISEPVTNPEDRLASCLANHAKALRMSDMDVLSNSVGFRCVECRTRYDLDVSEFETQQR